MDRARNESAVTALRAYAEPQSAVPMRMPPHSHEAEQALLGAILANNRAFEKVSDFLRPEHFAEPAHARIFEAAGKLIARGQIADIVTLRAFLEQESALAELGGVAYLAELAAAAITIVNAQEYGRLIHDLHLRRELIDIGEDVVNTAYRPDPDAPALEAIESAEQRLYDLATSGEADRGFRQFKTTLASAIAMAEAAYRREGHLAGLSTGLDDLDKLLGGLHPSDLLILAGRPGMGKTALATNIAFRAAERRADDAGQKGSPGVGFFSLEMSAEQLATRILSEKSGVNSEKIRRGDLSGSDFEKVVLAARELESLNLYIDDTPALSVSAVRSRARRLQRQQGLDLIVVDYLQLLRPTSGGSSRPENRVQEISDITRNLKAIAKELNVPVLALSQLSRAVEQREDKRPQLSDLRESGTIEQDADVVMFVFREEYYLERAEPSQRPDEAQEKFNDRYAHWQDRLKNAQALAELHIAKQRHGPTGKVLLHFESATTRFSNHGVSERMPDVRG